MEKRDTASWQPKSWVIGVAHGSTARAYDWNQLLQQHIIQDSLLGLPVLLTVEEDSSSFHVLNRYVNGQVLQFIYIDGKLVDNDSKSTWNADGLCIEGLFTGKQLQPVQASQEFWHSWQTFHPTTIAYK